MRRLATALSAALFLAAAPCAHAARTPRAAHTATLLPTGDILLTGGVDQNGVFLNSTELRLTATGTTYMDGPALTAARSSHTATLMANGCVLIAGGWNGVALSSADVYDPATNSIAASVTAGLGARYNHTATPLDNGKVLVCGGQSDAAGSVVATCALFTPTGTTGSGCGGSFAATSSLQLGRAFHTATLLKDGKVWFAGGLSAAGFTQTSERYDPAAGTFGPTQTLGTARAYHTATMMGDGKVLLAGGNNAQDHGNAGILDTLEIYDPIANTVTAGPRLSVRRQMHSATLSPDGSVMLFGGLGNVTTTYVSFSGALNSGSLTSTWSGSSTGSITGANASLTANVNLGVPVAGTIREGYVMFSTPSATFDAGVAYFTPGSDAVNGLRADLAGVEVTAGAVSTALTLTPMRGSVSFTPKSVTLNGNALSGSSLSFPGTLNETTSSIGLTSGTVKVLVTLPMSTKLSGAAVVAGTITITGGSIIQASSYTATITGGTIGIPPGTAINGSGFLVFTATATGLTGTISYTGPGGAQQFIGGMAVPQPGSQATVSLNATMNYVASPLDLSGATFSGGVSTVVIRGMVFGQAEFYNPKANSVSFSPPSGSVSASTAIAAFGHTATLLPNADVFVAGGLDCTAACAGLAAKNSGGVRSDLTFLPVLGNFTATSGSLLTPRVSHTSTLLPSGAILVAGGNNATSVLASGEVFDPAAGAFTATNNSLRDARNLHTATLLPNGRVLIAGGFTTAVTNSAEIYNPDSNSFAPTSVMLSSRSNHTATILPDGNVMVVGGFGESAITGTAEIYYSTSGAWKPLTASAARAQHTATLLKDGRLMVAGGVDGGGMLNTVSAYTPATNSWAALTSMPVALRSHSATLLFDGRVLVAGGNNGSGEVNSSYIYDPTTNLWTATSPLIQARFGHAATLLPNDTVIVSGGSTILGTIPTAIEIYRTDTNSWVTTGAAFAQGARANHTMTLADDGKVYVIGGTGASLLGQGEQSYFTVDADAHTTNAPPSIRRSTITSTSATPFLPGTNLTVDGLGFRGGTEASGGGSGATNSSFNFPHMTLQQIDGAGFVVNLTSAIYQTAANLTTMDTSLTVALPAAAQLPAGWYNIRVGANGVYSHGKFVQVGPAKPVAAPAAVAGAVLGTSSISWTWSAIAGVDGYNLYNAVSGVFVGTSPVSGSPQYTQTGLAAGAATSVSVAGYTLSGDGPRTTSSILTTFGRQVPQPIVAARTATSIEWGWSDPGDVINYRVYNATSGALLGTPVLNNFTQVGLATNTASAIFVSAIDEAGEGPLSPSVTAYTAAAAPALGATPAVPSTGSVLVSWSANENPALTLYRVDLTEFGSDGSVVGTVTASTTGFSEGFGGLKASTLYQYQIVAINGDDLDSAAVSGSTWTTPAAPIPLTALGNTPSSITVGWSANNNSSSATYQLTYSRDNFVLDIATAISFSANFKGTDATISGLITAATYSVRVIASNPFGQLSQFSNTVTTLTFNGGAQEGSIQGPMLAASDSSLLGTLGNGRQVLLRVPAHSFPSDVTVTVSSFAPAGTLCPNATNIAFSIVSSPALQPTGSVYLTFGFSPAELGTIPVSRALLLRYDPGSNTCVPLQTAVDTVSGQMTARINHFSLFQVGTVPLSTTPDTTRLFPNPYYAGRDGFLTIDNAPPDARVRIFTLRGELVLDQKANSTGMLAWSGTNGFGRKVASGVYLVMIESGGSKKILKLGVIR